MSSLSMRTVFASVRDADEGQDLLEYAMLVALIALVAVGAVRTVGDTITSVFWDVIAAATSVV